MAHEGEGGDLACVGADARASLIDVPVESVPDTPRLAANAATTSTTAGALSRQTLAPLVGISVDAT